MTERPAPTWKMRALVFGAWALLTFLLAAYHVWWLPHSRVGVWPPPLLPLWLLVVDIGAIVAGLVLACTRWLPGRTPMRRYWVSVCVGVICTAATGFLVYDVWLHMGMRVSMMCGLTP